jgi:hypothetical protein
MTQTEYENQTGDTLPSKAPIGSVVIERFHTWKQEIVIDGKPVEVRLYDLCLWGNYGWSYRTNPKYPDSKTLYTMDDHGNVKSPSVFREP